MSWSRSAVSDSLMWGSLFGLLCLPRDPAAFAPRCPPPFLRRVERSRSSYGCSANNAAFDLSLPPPSSKTKPSPACIHTCSILHYMQVVAGTLYMLTSV